jgi:pyruvate dehydrogenase E2 component (dihydrolipoamide acetyltransferase)
MRQEIVMPQLGLTMTEGAVSAWLKKPGDKVERGEILFMVQTDKVEMEVESFVSGLLDNILVEPDVLVKVGTVIATVEDGRAAKSAPPRANHEAISPREAPPKQVVPPKAEPQREIPISPRARKLANSLGIDLALLVPAKPGRITEDDVRSFDKNTGKSPKPNRGIIAQRMTASFQSAPHFYLTAHVDVSKLVELRAANVDAFQELHGVKITYTDFFLRALAIALKERPAVNSFWESNQVESLDTVDISLAAQTPHGLLAPVIRKADTLTFAELATQRCALIKRTRAGKLLFSDMEGGSATLSNLGAYGVDEFHPILNPPQSVILATGRIAQRPFVVGDTVQARATVFLTLASDHRVLDGADAADFLDRIRFLLENPSGSLL